MEQDFIVQPQFQDPQIRQGFEYGAMTIQESKRFAAKVGVNGFEFITSGFCALVTNISFHRAVRVYGESFEGDSPLKSSNETRKMDEMSPFNPAPTRRRVRNQYIRARKIEMERQFSFHKIVGTWKNNLLNPGFAKKWQSRGMTTYFLNEIAGAPVQRQIGNLVINGDRGSAFKDVSQIDGVLKILAKSSAMAKNHKIFFKLPTLNSSHKVHLLVSNKSISIPFVTDEDTTMAAVVDAINGVAYQSFQLMEAELIDLNGEEHLKVTSRDIKKNAEIRVNVSTSSSIEWKSVKNIGSGGVTHVKEESAKEEETPYQMPLIDWTNFVGTDGFRGTVTMDNLSAYHSNMKEIIDWLYALSLRLAEMRRELQGMGKTLVTYVSPEMKTLIDLSLVMLFQDKQGSMAQPAVNILKLGLREHPNLRGNVFFATYAGNVHFGTDLISDIASFDMDFNWREKVVDVRMEGAIGVSILEKGHVVTNALGMANQFGELDDYTDQFSDVFQVDESLIKQMNFEKWALEKGWTKPA